VIVEPVVGPLLLGVPHATAATAATASNAHLRILNTPVSTSSADAD
jgi:hypothetical protein